MSTPDSILPEEAFAHYCEGVELTRLTRGAGVLEFVRTQELLGRYLPKSPAVILDVGGGPGAYARWLADLGYDVHLLDPVPLHVSQATDSTRLRSRPLASAVVGDARALPFDSESADAVLLLGPLYHITERAQRLAAWREAFRVLRSQGRVFAVGISRFASALDGLRSGHIGDTAFVSIYQRDLQDGQHRNPTNHPGYFTTAYFHQPSELCDEMRESGFYYEATFGVEGPAWLLQDFTEQWADSSRRERLLEAVRSVEREPSLLGASVHLLAVGTKNH